MSTRWEEEAHSKLVRGGGDGVGVEGDDSVEEGGDGVGVEGRSYHR